MAWLDPPIAIRSNSSCITMSQVKGRLGWSAWSIVECALPLTLSSTVLLNPASARPPMSVSGPVAVQSAAKPRLVSERSGAQCHSNLLPPATPTSPFHTVPATPVRHGRFLTTTLAGIVATMERA
ncbi:MAG: hypothetical protein KYX69_14745 [Sphingomonas sp.]|uniref:hypothetical protein n=1 Tax=Sphingomonas sp. TaxID=28214 RepID=UPI002632C36A|nr:hypothetical protein [Sphingomonas sp.]MDK2768965.1 hypothetical protein [Sphingomonas sp.]